MTTQTWMTLNNGAKILKQRGNVVLCAWNGEYVTWKVDEKGNAYWGHYFQTYGDALEDFSKR